MSLAPLLAAVERSKGRDADALVALLKFLRVSQIRRSDITVKWGAVALAKHGSRLGDERWSIHEQTLIAALDLDDAATAKSSEDALAARFRSGARIGRLQGMCEEARGEYEKAGATYAKLLVDNAANAAALRREVCIVKAESNLDVSKNVVNALNGYLEKFQSDAGAWQALAETYTRAANWRSAAYCYEELTLFEPLAHHYHCRLGEIHYTQAAALQGRKQLETYRTARKYFAQAVQLQKEVQGRFVRAAAGLLVCCAAVAECEGPDADAADAELNAALGAVAAGCVKAAYKKDAPALAPCVAPLLAVFAPPYAQ
ncbi:hypothetical protein M885DRAFT_513302 [Pelagophyceae sp. CCMP2097]|nr:hypothetical protein M885DRAFT_513302 [Pelagophyceae sp. CCMP2097]